MITTEEAKKIQDQNLHLLQENEHLKLLNAKLRHRLFGSKSEKVDEIIVDQMIFNDIEVEANKATDDELDNQTEMIEGYSRKKGRGKKKPFPENLDREEIVIDLADEEKTCPHDGTQLKEIGEEITEKLRCYPARTVVLVEKKKKYACPCCAEHVAQAKTNSILPKTIATPEILSYLMFSKFFQGLPLYRLEELFKLQ